MPSLFRFAQVDLHSAMPCARPSWHGSSVGQIQMLDAVHGRGVRYRCEGGYSQADIVRSYLFWFSDDVMKCIILTEMFQPFYAIFEDVLILLNNKLRPIEALLQFVCRSEVPNLQEVQSGPVPCGSRTPRHPGCNSCSRSQAAEKHWCCPAHEVTS